MSSLDSPKVERQTGLPFTKCRISMRSGSRPSIAPDGMPFAERFCFDNHVVDSRTRGCRMSNSSLPSAGNVTSFNRWLVPPAALSIHLAIGEAYAFNVFNEPLTRVIGINATGARRLEADHARLDLQSGDRVLGSLGRRLRKVARTSRAAARQCSPPPAVLPAAFWFRRWASACTRSFCSISATACWAGSGWGWDIFRPSRR